MQKKAKTKGLLSHALRETFRSGYTFSDLRADVLAGLVTGIVALPLSMALAIATGVPPEHGLYTAIVAGVVVALTGGAPVQVSGPTAAFVVLLVPITSRYGLGGLCLATLMAGVLLMAMSLARVGTLVRFVPHTVTLGFTGGIGIVIGTLQLKDFLGLPVGKMPEAFHRQLMTLVGHVPQMHLSDAAVGASTLAMLLLVPKVTKRIPPALVALSVATFGSALLHRFSPQFSPATIMERFSYVVDGVRHAGIPRLPPLPSLGWFTMGPGGETLAINRELIVELLPNAVSIALLAAIESLLAAVVADSMSGRRHHADSELLGLSLANVAAPFFGGFASTGAIARTAINIRSGARSPISALVHAGFVLVAMVALAPWLGYLPMASMAALLLTVAYNMSDAKGIVRAVRTSPPSDVLVLSATLILTVTLGMVVSVISGVLLSTVLFARQMARAAAVAHEEANAETHDALPDGVHVHTIDGPLFFGDAERALAQLRDLSGDTRAVVLDLSRMSLVDASGLAGLGQAVARLEQQDVPLALIAPQRDDVEQALKRAGVLANVASSSTIGVADRAAALAWATGRAGR